MNYAREAIKGVLDTVPLTDDFDEDKLNKQISRVWSETASAISSSAAVQSDSLLWLAYRPLLEQAKNATGELRFLGEPEVFYAPTKSGKGVSPLWYLLLIPTLLVLILDFTRSIPLNIGMILLSGAALLTLAIFLGAYTLQTRRSSAGTGSVHVAQKVNLPKLRASLEAIAGSVDTGAEGLYERLNQKNGEQRNLGDGMALAKSVLKQYFSGGDTQSIMSDARIYLSQHGIEVVEYTPERANLFNLMPSNGTKTIQPALIQHTKTMENGMPCEKETLLEMGVACVPSGETP